VTIADVSILVLVGLFVAASVSRRFDLGLAALPAAFLVGLAAGIPADEVTGFFPGDFVVLIVGVSALFATAHLNGTLDWLLDRLLALTGGRLVLVVLVPFLVGAVLTAVGTLPAAATAIVAPIALGFAARYTISPLIASVVGITGIISGLLSPLAVYGVSARRLGDQLGLGLPGSAPALFLVGGLVAGLLVTAGCIVVGLRTGGLPRGRLDSAPSAPEETARGSRTARVLTVGAMLVVVGLSLGFGLNIGYLGMIAAVLLHVALGTKASDVVARIPWSVVLLIGGLLTYVGLMQELGAFERLSGLLSVEGSPMISLLILCYVAGVTSFAASSIAVFVTTMPLLPPLVEAGVSPVGAVLALALASVLVDVNPLGITGGLLLGAAEPSARERLFRNLLIYGIVSIAVAPVLTWALFSWW
jgi:di/tricarboxylate transporter